MLEGRRALDLALDLAQMPTLAGAMRAQPIPSDTLVAIRIAAGCSETGQQAEDATGLPLATIREATALYLQMILLAPESDSYRVLGVLPGASRSEMREHMRWLLKWLHPDRDPDDWESVFAGRVIKAWRDVSRQAGTDGFENARSQIVPHRNGPQRVAPINRWVALPIEDPAMLAKEKSRLLLLLAAAIGAALLVAILVPTIVWFAGSSIAEVSQ